MQSFPASGCGAVGRMVASDTRDLRFESQHRQLSILNVHICQLQFRKDENKEREAGIGTLKKVFQLGGGPLVFFWVVLDAPVPRLN